MALVSESAIAQYRRNLRAWKTKLSFGLGIGIPMTTVLVLHQLWYKLYSCNDIQHRLGGSACVLAFGIKDENGLPIHQLQKSWCMGSAFRLAYEIPP